MKILIVDDENYIRSLLVRVLSEDGYEIAEASSGEEAIEKVAIDSYDIVITDLKMPGIGGEELIEKVSAINPNVLFFIITAYPTMEGALKALRTKVYDFIIKPIQLDDLKKRVKNAVEKVLMTREISNLFEELRQKNTLLEKQKEQLDERIVEYKGELERKLKSLEETQSFVSHQNDRMNTIIDTISDGLVVTDTDESVIVLNVAAEKQLDVEGFNTLSRPLSRIEAKKELQDHLIRSHKTALEGNTSIENAVCVNEEEEMLFYLIQTTPVRDRMGEIVGALSTIRDVSESKRIEQMKSQFLSLVSHELRTPITGIKVYAKVLSNDSREVTPEQRAQCLKEIEMQSDRLIHIVDKLINLSRIEQEDFQVDFETFALKDVLDSAVVAFGKDLKERNITLHTRMDDETVRVEAAKEDIKRIVQILIENAIKFSEGNGEIVITIADKDSRVCVSVRDCGIGIAQKDQERIFETFSQVENPLTRQHGGIGLGLSVARKILAAHNSRITVESEPGKGSTFSFLLKKVTS